MNIRKLSITAIGVTLLSGCSSDGWKAVDTIFDVSGGESPYTELSEAGSKIGIAEIVTAADSMTFTELSDIKCIRRYDLRNLKNCLRNRAADAGGSVILIRETHPDICKSGESAETGRCVAGTARVLKKRAQ